MAGEGLLSIAKEQFKQARGELQHIVVPEWQDSEIYFFSAPSVDEYIRISGDIASGNQTEAVLTAFMLFARDASGRRYFGEHNRSEIREFFDARTVSRIVAQMGVFASLFDDDEEAAKND